MPRTYAPPRHRSTSGGGIPAREAPTPCATGRAAGDARAGRGGGAR
jgi:hypothetical protein